jgi:8-oxo-dGTP pyrophosphatase MutT (NUDIX family)
VSDSAAPRPFSAELLREPLRARLLARAWSPAALSSDTPAAVLIPLFESDDDVHVWLVRRAATLRRHGGQVAFPGGKTDAAESALETALREAHEEIGLPAVLVDVLGRLDDLPTRTGFTIAPFVGWIRGPFIPAPNESEVARVFSVPLRAFFAKPCGIPPFHGHTVVGERVWGATGKILRDLVAVIREL